MSVKYQQTLLLSSNDTPDNKTLTTDDGARFSVSLDYDIKLPDTAMISTVKVDSATIWYNTPNITSGVNSEFYIDDNGTPYVVSFPTGIYTVSEINSEINRQIINLGGPSNLITITGNNATQKVIIQFNTAGIQIDFTQVDTFRDVLGFNSRLSPSVPSALVNQTDTADNVASLNNVEYYLIHSDIVSNGFNINNYSSDVIAQILIPQGTSPGSQIVYTPQNPDKITSNDLIKNPRNQLTFYLTDQDNNLVNTLTEIWSLKLVIEYELPLLF